ncbi:MAG: hypothetical protein M3Y64_08770, partial [Gemmatimonadota bacterium]|nr:hypothetical protein [Gemmatimonadota bacterium]
MTAPTMIAVRKPSPPRHPWALVAPWWKWSSVSDSMKGRLTRPQLQKYETSKLVDEFIKNPQHFLKWMDEDLVHTVQAAAPAKLGKNNKPRRFSELAYVIDPLRTRKIFLDTHKRFYLVVCQIHCDAPGFPRAARGDVCNAGFVVRRRTSTIPAAGAKAAGEILKSINGARSKLGAIELQATRAAAINVASLSQAVSSTVAVQRASTRALLETERTRLFEWAANFKVAPKLQGWFPDPSLEKLGAWANVDEKPGALNGESTFPLYPLIPPRGDADHAGQFGNIYFGLLPTGTGETDTQGNARFDDQQYYEVTCYAERHLIPHDRGSPCHCPDSLFWSLPTDAYKLASHFDVVGTGKRPVTVQMPDLDALAAQAAPTFGVAFAKPARSLMVTADGQGTIKKIGRSRLPEICSFSIPLITIVASFVFELFLPVVMLAFGLWFMLKLKFCILPEIEVAAGVTAEISLDVSLAFEASISAKVDASIDANFGPASDHGSPEIVTALKSKFAPIALANMEVTVVAASTGRGPDLTDGIEFEVE